MNAPVPEPTSSVGEKITPPRTRQLSTTSRESARYHDIPPANRVNCCSSDEPMYLEAYVSSSVAREPLVGSIGLFIRGKFAEAVRAASTRFSLSCSITSAVHALKKEQKLWAVASVRP